MGQRTTPVKASTSCSCSRAATFLAAQALSTYLTAYDLRWVSVWFGPLRSNWRTVRHHTLPLFGLSPQQRRAVRDVGLVSHAGFAFTTGSPRELPWAGRLRSFCPQCATPLIFKTTADAPEVGVTVSSFDDPGKVTPADHTWVSDRLPWIRLADELPTFPQNRAG